MPSYEQTGKKKLWSVRFRAMTEDGEKNMRLSGFATKKDARIAYEKFMESERKEPTQIRGSITFGELFKAYRVYARNQLKESSYYDTCGRMKNHVLPYFEDMDVKTILPITILKWQTELSEKYSRKYVCVIRGAFSAVWTFGRRFYNIQSDPLSLVPLPAESSAPQEEMQVWTPDEFKQFISAADEPVWSLFFRTLYMTGCRKGEIEALQSDDISDGVIGISKSITRKGDAAWTVTTPKNKQSVRKISVDKSLTDELKQMPGPFVFGGTAPYGNRTIDRKFQKYIKRSGVKTIRIHDLRHSHASLLISQGVSIVAVSKRLGHKSTQQTLDTYSHMMPSDDAMILKILGTI